VLPLQRDDRATIDSAQRATLSVILRKEARLLAPYRTLWSVPAQQRFSPPFFSAFPALVQRGVIAEDLSWLDEPPFRIVHLRGRE
jgi:hypothetical protein